MGQGDANVVFRSCRARRGARGCGPGDVRRDLHGRVFSHGAGRTGEGIRVTEQSAELQPEARPMAAKDFFDRARARLTLTIPPALTDPMAHGARGDLDLNPSMWERAGVAATKPAAVLIPVIDRA